MTGRVRRSALTLLFVSSLTVGCSGLGDNSAQDKACDPGGRRASALQAEPALSTPPPGHRRVKVGIYPSTHDEIETHICSDVLLAFTLEPASDGETALRPLERQLKADGWTGVRVDDRIRAIGASKELFPGGMATLQGNVIPGTEGLRVRVALPPAVR